MSPPSSAQLDEYLAFTIQVAKDANELILRKQQDLFALRSAQGATSEQSLSFAEQAKQEVNKSIEGKVLERYPGHWYNKFGEKYWDSKKLVGVVPIPEGYGWVANAIDGVNRFIHGRGEMGCSIGLVYNGEPVLGVLGHCGGKAIYYARQGGGAFKLPLDSDVPLGLPLLGKPQPLESFQACSVGFMFNEARIGGFHSKLADVSKLLKNKEDGGIRVDGVGYVGSTAMNMIKVASGEMDIFPLGASKPWHVCARLLLVQESGGLIVGNADSFQRYQEGDIDSLGKIMLNRRYTYVRAVAPSKTETAKQVQESIVKEAYEVIQHY